MVTFRRIGRRAPGHPATSLWVHCVTLKRWDTHFRKPRIRAFLSCYHKNVGKNYSGYSKFPPREASQLSCHFYLKSSFKIYLLLLLKMTIVPLREERDGVSLYLLLFAICVLVIHLWWSYHAAINKYVLRKVVVYLWRLWLRNRVAEWLGEKLQFFKIRLFCMFMYIITSWLVFSTADPQDENKIGIDGIQQFCDDLSLDPASISVLVIAWKFRAATQCEFSKKEFVDGMTELGWVYLIRLQILLCRSKVTATEVIGILIMPFQNHCLI